MIKVINSNKEKFKEGKQKGEVMPIRRAGFDFPPGESEYPDEQFTDGQLAQIQKHPLLTVEQTENKAK